MDAKSIRCETGTQKMKKMSDEKFQNRYRIPSARATWHNYNEGTYFVTICTYGRKHYFGEISDGEMQMTPIGEYAQECIRQIPQHHPYAEIPFWVVMPNHIHAVIVIYRDKIPYEKRNVKLVSKPVVDGTFRKSIIVETFRKSIGVETFHETSLQEPEQTTESEQTTEPEQSVIPEQPTIPEPIQIATHMQSWLSIIVRLFKQSVTLFAKDNSMPFAWQSRFHDYIIRNDAEMNRIARYIGQNVAEWTHDDFF